MIARLIWRMTKEKDIRRYFWSTAFDCALHNLPAFGDVLFAAALYLHLGPFARYVRACTEEQIASTHSGNGHPHDSRVALGELACFCSSRYSLGNSMDCPLGHPLQNNSGFATGKT
jgi:Domain of unknown function (DUF4070)